MTRREEHFWDCFTCRHSGTAPSAAEAKRRAQQHAQIKHKGSDGHVGFGVTT